MDTYAPFRTWYRDNPEFGRSDSLAEAALLSQREALIEQLISGAGDISETLDCLAQQGIDPDQWLDVVTDNVQYVIDSGIRFTSNDKGLFLPVH